MKVAPDLLEAIVEHARRDAPNECCGIVLATGGVAEEVIALENRARVKKMGFDMDELQVFKLSDDTERLGAIYHSHPRSDPTPSQTDLHYSQGWPGVVWIIVGNVHREPTVRAWLMDGKTYDEVELTQ